jgi:uncharacterized protein YaaQ
MMSGFERRGNTTLFFLDDEQTDDHESRLVAVRSIERIVLQTVAVLASRGAVAPLNLDPGTAEDPTD